MKCVSPIQLVDKTLEMLIKKCLESNEDLGVKAHLKWEFIYDDVKYTTKPKQVNYTASFTYYRGTPFKEECYSGKQNGCTFNNYFDYFLFNSWLPLSVFLTLFDIAWYICLNFSSFLNSFGFSFIDRILDDKINFQ